MLIIELYPSLQGTKLKSALHPTQEEELVGRETLKNTVESLKAEAPVTCSPYHPTYQTSTLEEVGALDQAFRALRVLGRYQSPVPKGGWVFGGLQVPPMKMSQ